MPSVSNGKFLALLPAAPLPGAGWTVRVIAHTDLYAYARGTNPPALAQLSRWQSLTVSPAISEVGAGSITLGLSDPVFAYALRDGRTPDSLWRYRNLWVVYEDGQWRGEFFGDKVTLPRTSSAEAAGRTVTITGTGGAGALARASVLTPQYPKTPAANTIDAYQFKNVPVMAAWLQLLAAAQQRGTIPFVHCRFTASKDTGGAKWEDTPAAATKTATTAVTLGTVPFATGTNFALSPAGTAAVASITAAIKKATEPQVTVTGHTDNVGSKVANQQTGLDRANTVRNAILVLQPELSILPAVSKGETQPIASNNTAAGRAKNRRVVVTYTTAASTSDSIFTPTAGTTLLDLLQQLTSGRTTAPKRGPIHCEWIMGKGFELQVRSQVGEDRSARTVFHEGSTCLAAEDDEYDRSTIANLIAVQNQHHRYASTTDPASIAKWGQAELYTKISGDHSVAVQALIADTQRRAYRDESSSSTLSIVPGPYRKPFRDFGLGDWIGLYRTRGKLPGRVEKHRVMAISVTIDKDARASYEVTLNSTRTARTTWLQTQIDALINTKKGIEPYIQDDEPGGGLPGDLWTPLTTKAGTA